MIRKLAALIVLVLTVLRLTRFVTSDFLGEWVLVRPLKKWAFDAETEKPNTSKFFVTEADRERAELRLDAYEKARETGDPNPNNGWRSKLVKGLDCPFCVGFWLGLLALVLWPLARVPFLGKLIRLGAGALALNYVVGHVSSRLDG